VRPRALGVDRTGGRGVSPLELLLGIVWFFPFALPFPLLGRIGHLVALDIPSIPFLVHVFT